MPCPKMVAKGKTIRNITLIQGYDSTLPYLVIDAAAGNESIIAA